MWNESATTASCQSVFPKSSRSSSTHFTSFSACIELDTLHTHSSVIQTVQKDPCRSLIVSRIDVNRRIIMSQDCFAFADPVVSFDGLGRRLDSAEWMRGGDWRPGYRPSGCANRGL